VPMNDDAPEQSLPIFLSNDGDEAAQQGSSRMRIAGVVILATLAIGGAVLASGHRPTLAAVSSLFVGASAPEPGTDRAAPPLQSSADAQAAPPAAGEAPPDQPTTATAEPAAADPSSTPPADQQQIEAKDKAASDALFVQFQAWAQKQNGAPEPQQDQAQQDRSQQSPAPVPQDAPALTRQSAESTQSDPARVDQAAAAPVRAAQKRRAVHELRNARAELEAARKMQAKLPHPHGAPTRAMEDANTQEAPAPTSQTPSLLQILGWR
jgi:hypothetical protein